MAGFLFCGAILFGEIPEELAALYPAETVSQLEKKGEVTSFIKENGTLTYLPRLLAANVIADKIGTMKPIFTVEVCILHKNGTKVLDSDKNLLTIYNTLLGISTLKGILYYSESRKMMREFFYDAYRIEAPDKKDRLPDLHAEKEIPFYNRLYAYQHDSSFGENTFDVDYRFDKKYFLMKMENVNQIWYGIIPIVDPGNLVYFILVYPSGDYLLFYSVICVKGANPFGLMESKAASFYNRIKALDDWFVKQSGLF
jgi:hypothetical protein